MISAVGDEAYCPLHPGHPYTFFRGYVYTLESALVFKHLSSIGILERKCHDVLTAGLDLRLVD